MITKIMSNGNNNTTKLVVALVVVGAIVTFMVQSKRKSKPKFRIPFDDFDGNNSNLSGEDSFSNLTIEEQSEIVEDYEIPNLEEGSDRPEKTIGRIKPPKPNFKGAVGDIITLDVSNQTDGTMPLVSVLGNDQDPMDTANATTQYNWDFTSFTLTNENTVSVQCKENGSPYFNTKISAIDGNNLNAIVNALNTLNVGQFFITTSGGSTFINNYNNNVTFGDINVYVTSIVYEPFLSGIGFDNVVNFVLPQPNGGALVGGNYTSYQATLVDNLAYIYPDGSYNSAYNQGSGFNNYIDAMIQQSNGNYVVGGAFTDFNGITTNYLARLYDAPQQQYTYTIYNSSFAYGSGFDNYLWSIAIQSDGKILCGGDFTSYNGTPTNYIIRLNADGSIDNTFVYGSGCNQRVNAIAIQSDGKILLGGLFTSYDGTLANYIIRLNSDGSVDGTFVYGSGFQSEVIAITIQSDGKIVVGGDFFGYDGTTLGCITRLNTNGSIDGTFVSGSGFDFQVNSIAIQTDGKIICGGNFTTYDGTPANYIIRLNTNGSVDNTFVYGSGFNALVSINCIQIQSDGNVVVCGYFTTYNGTTSNRIVRINTNGSIDNTFNIGSGFNGSCIGLAIQTDGKIICSGVFSLYNGNACNCIVRINSDGSLDTSFNIGSGFDSSPYVIKINQSNGNIYVGGSFSSFNGVSSNFIIGLLETTQQINQTSIYNFNFDYGSGFNFVTNAIKIQSDGKIICGGQFTNFDGTTSNRVVRINTDGSIDNTFNIGTGISGGSNEVFTIGIQSNGSVLLGGSFTTFNGNSVNNIVRLTSSGTYDSTFNIGIGFNGVVLSIAIQSDGKILVGGTFTSYNGTGANFIIRLNPDGSIDNTFVYGSGFDTNVRSIAIQSDGKILVGGDFSSYDGNTIGQIIRLNSDGSIDNTFNSGTGFVNGVISIAIQSDGKILCGGSFSSYDGTSVNRIVRLENNGLIDNTFTIGTGFDNIVQVISYQTDGKIYVGGDFNDYNGTGLAYIVRLNSDGSIDNTWDFGTAFDNVVYAIELNQNENILYVGGEFTTFDSIGANRIVSLYQTEQNILTLLDVDFNTNLASTLNGNVYAIALQTNQQLLVGGNFSGTYNHLIRINTDGTTDTSFQVTDFDADVLAIALQSNGSIIVGGAFTIYQGVTNNKIVRLFSNGSLDTSFNIGSGFDNSVTSLVIQTNGKVVVGGAFTSYNGVTTNHIVRLNADGSLDTSFNIGSGFNNDVNTLSLMSDGTIIVGGAFTSYNGHTYNRIVRLNTDGSVKTLWIIGSGFDNDVYYVSPQNNVGCVFIGGSFTTFNGIVANRIICLST